MHIEVQVALNFVISYLYNKLPRRRVNIFGEELEKALKDKFSGHWYPEKPFKGSAFRCLKTGDPVDAVLERAACESGVPIQDVLENLPHELAVWVDPGEVSYRIGEKGAVKVLFSEATDAHEETSADREVNKTFNPEAQCFRPIEAAAAGLSGLSLSPPAPTASAAVAAAAAAASSAPAAPRPRQGSASPFPVGGGAASGAPSASTSPAPPKTPPSPAPSFLPRAAQPLTFTTATFAQTKFGSTKLKTNSKRANRMSPTEFSNYIKQRAMQQQMHQPPVSPGGRSLSPHQHHPAAAPPPPPPDYHQQQHYYQQHGHGGHPPPAAFHHYGPAAAAGGYPPLPDLYHPSLAAAASHSHHSQFYPPPQGAPPALPPPDKQQLLDTINNFGLASYPAGQYQHLLVAN